MFLYLHAPRRICANPPNPRSGPWPTQPAKAETIYPDYEQAYIFDDSHEPEHNRVITIDV